MGVSDLKLSLRCRNLENPVPKTPTAQCITVCFVWAYAENLPGLNQMQLCSSKEKEET